MPKYHHHLTDRDECVPSTHIGMYSIFRNPTNKNVYVSEKRCQNMRQSTFNEVYKLFVKYGSPNFADFFNYNIDVIAQIGMNHFANHPKIAPVSKLIECFQTDKRINKDKIPHRFISFGINRKLLFKYFKSRDEAKKNNKQVKIPELQKYNDLGKRDLILYGEEIITGEHNRKIKVNKTLLYHKFVDWCDIQGIKHSDGIMMAFEALFELYPLDSIKDTIEYDFLTEFDKPLFARPKKEQEYVDRVVRISGGICALSDKIIARYNRDPDNITKRLDFDKYINNALHLLNSNMDLIYRDPELYIEQQELKEMEEYNGIKGETENDST